MHLPTKKGSNKCKETHIYHIKNEGSKADDSKVVEKESM